MGKGKSDNKMFYLVIVLLLVVVGLVVMIAKPFSAVDTETETEGGNEGGSGALVQCDRGFEDDVTFVTRNAFDKGVNVNNVTYKVWKDVDGAKIPQPDSTGTLTVGYDESYDVVVSADGYLLETATFSVDAQCNGPTDKVFYLTQLPTSIDVRMDNSKVDLAVSPTNRIPFVAEDTRNVKLTINGQSKTQTETIIVFDAHKDEFTVESSAMASATLPEAHTTLTGYKSYAFKLGTLDQAQDLITNFDLIADMNVVAGDYNVSYTIYQYQTGYTNTDSGEFVVGNVIEDNDDVVLLPTFTGTVPTTVN